MANITALARIAKLFEMPIIVSTVNVQTGRNQPTIQITDALSDVKPIDRTSINPWENEDFNRAVKGRGP
ncbi:MULTISPECIES: hypothetical protein [Rhizobium/Agrobacterium group]|uniref:hypothetical protein n=1 Tax=Rhizobium/Agrobacterium group TaxID=227290 RepID=UPI00191108D8|nr:hypothetical protein [Rhizobium sp. Root483D2]